MASELVRAQDARLRRGGRAAGSAVNAPTLTRFSYRPRANPRSLGGQPHPGRRRMPMSTPTARLAMVTLDCADAEASAAFWSALLGWDVAHSERDYAMLTGPTTRSGSVGSRTTSRRGGRTSTAASSSTSTWPSPTSTTAEKAAVDLGRHRRRPAARRDVASHARPLRSPVLLDQGRELGLSSTAVQDQDQVAGLHLLGAGDGEALDDAGVGAVMAASIFIASIEATVWPASTCVALVDLQRHDAGERRGDLAGVVRGRPSPAPATSDDDRLGRARRPGGAGR